MTTPTGVSRRIQQCIERLQIGDYEGALVNLFPAIDKTAKKRRPKAGVGNRIRAFLKDEEVIITAVGTGNVFKNCRFDNMSLPEALYKFGRTPISHEGELDSRLSFNPNGGLKIGRHNWNLPARFIDGMALAVITARENKGEQTSNEIDIVIFGKRFRLNDIWGKPESVHMHICEKFSDPKLFSGIPNLTD